MSLTILEEYIETGNFQDLELLLSKSPSLVIQNTSHDISPLLLACYYHKPQIIQIILKYITTITIHEACAVGLKEHVQMMIEHKKDIVNEISSQGLTPLGIATHFGQEDITRLLLSHHANPNIPSQNKFNIYPLHTALSTHRDAISKMLIEAGADVNALQQGNISPLHIAAQQGNIELIILLLEQGADVSAVTNTGLSIAELAASKGFSEIAKILKSS